MTKVERGTRDAQRGHKRKWEVTLCHYIVLMEDGLDDQDSILGSVRVFSIRSRVYTSSGHQLTFYSKRPERRADHSPTYSAKFVLS